MNENPTKVKCLNCGDVIFSRTYGQFVSCKCNKVAVDETSYYMRILGDKYEIVEEVNE
jgi:hypothetical protein